MRQFFFVLIVFAVGFWGGIGATLSMKKAAVDPSEYTIILDPLEGGGYSAKFVRP